MNKSNIKKKKLDCKIKLNIYAGKATPAPPVGPALGAKKVNIMAFCKEFNDHTKDLGANVPVPVIISVYEDKTFTFECKTPPAGFFLKKFSSITKGSSAPGKEASVASVTMDHCREIAKQKLNDLNAYDIEKAALTIKGTARSMGIDVIEHAGDK